jgi:hypothetical protein
VDEDRAGTPVCKTHARRDRVARRTVKREAKDAKRAALRQPWVPVQHGVSCCRCGIVKGVDAGGCCLSCHLRRGGPAPLTAAARGAILSPTKKEPTQETK